MVSGVSRSAYSYEDDTCIWIKMNTIRRTQYQEQLLHAGSPVRNICVYYGFAELLDLVAFWRISHVCRDETIFKSQVISITFIMKSASVQILSRCCLCVIQKWKTSFCIISLFSIQPQFFGNFPGGVIFFFNIPVNSLERVSVAQTCLIPCPCRVLTRHHWKGLYTANVWSWVLYWGI